MYAGRVQMTVTTFLSKEEIIDHLKDQYIKEE
jgi:hypothetical protein